MSELKDPFTHINFRIVDNAYGNAIAFELDGKWRIISPIPPEFKHFTEYIEENLNNET